MELDVDILINFFKEKTKKNHKTEFNEQDDASGGSTSSTGDSGKTPRKWTSGIKDGPARGYASDPKHKWSNGIDRRKNPLFYD